jgi:formylglycine-generating enzyme required for sulfatase activity
VGAHDGSTDATTGDGSSSSGGDAAPATPPSCAASDAGAGTGQCGPTNDSCCTSLEVTGGSFYRTYTNNGSGPTGEADQAQVSGFRLDQYLVTVGRFRQFVAAWNGGSGWTPPAGSGKHTHLNGGLGLANSGTPGTYETGWVASDSANVAPTDANLTTYCNGSGAISTWTTSAGNNENLPINCANWFEAAAFCIWDGGFLPSDTEQEYAAAGGGDSMGQREYPWGTTDPGLANQYAIYHCYYPTGMATGACSGTTNIAPVGTTKSGFGRWGQFDLTGEIWEWNVDWYMSPFVDCTDCAYLDMTTGGRTLRGGVWDDAVGGLLPTYQTHGSPFDRSYGLGFRCARTP